MLRRKTRPGYSMYDETVKLGFTLRPEVVAIMAPHMDPEQHGYAHYEGLTAAELQQLARVLPAHQARDHQGDAPTFGRFVELAARFPRMTFHGYVIGPSRADERVTIEGFYVPLEGLTAEQVAELAALRAEVWQMPHDVIYTYWG